MVQNIDSILQRGERLDLLVDKTDTLAGQAYAFRRGARSVRRQQWWKNQKITMLTALVVVVSAANLWRFQVLLGRGPAFGRRSPESSPRHLLWSALLGIGGPSRLQEPRPDNGRHLSAVALTHPASHLRVHCAVLWPVASPLWGWSVLGPRQRSLYRLFYRPGCSVVRFTSWDGPLASGRGRPVLYNAYVLKSRYSSASTPIARLCVTWSPSESSTASSRWRLGSSLPT